MYKTILKSPEIYFYPSFEEYYNELKKKTRLKDTFEEFQKNNIKDEAYFYWADSILEESWLSFFNDFEKELAKLKIKESFLEVLNAGSLQNQHGYSKVFALNLKNLMQKIKNSENLKIEIKKSKNEMTIIRYNKDKEKGTVFIIRPKSYLKTIREQLKYLKRVPKV